MFEITRRVALKASPSGSKRLVATASGGFPSGNFSSGLSGISGSMSTSAIGSGMLNNLDTLLAGLIPEDENALFRYYDDIYNYDPICGSAVDLMSTLPFSDFNLVGGRDDQQEVYWQNIHNLNMQSYLPDMSVEYLAKGRSIGTFLYDKEKNFFTDILPHDSQNVQVEESATYNSNPRLILKVTDQLRRFLTSKDPYFQKLKKRIPESMAYALLNSQHVRLDPMTTLYMPRRTSTRGVGTSIYRRIIPVYLLEKLLYRGTLTELSKRQRSTTQVKMGTDYWEPQDADLQMIVNLLQQAELDPLSSIIATRQDVDIVDVRPAGDFVKWTDFIDVFNPMKLKSMGVSDAFLSGEANWNCVIGPTLIHTKERGICRIDDLASRTNGDVQDFGLTVGSRYGNLKAAKWLYQGKAPTFKVSATSGHTVTGTGKHRLLELQTDLGTDWVRIKDLEKGSYLCVSSVPNLRKTKLSFKGAPKLVNFNQPKVMTPELAFVLGVFVAEGHVLRQYRNGKTCAIAIGNNDKRLNDKYLKCLRKVFGSVHATFVEKPAVKGVRKASTQVIVSSQELCAYFEWLGCYSGVTAKGKTPAWNKVVPWSIMQADADSQASFLAAYLEGDGSIYQYSGELDFSSVSRTLIDQIQAILQGFGVFARIRGKGVVPRSGNTFKATLSASEAFDLSAIIKPYVVTKFYPDKKRRASKSAGVPTEYVAQLLKERWVGRGKTFTWTNDDGNIVEQSIAAFNDAIYRSSTIRYDVDNTALIKALSVVSKSAANNLKTLLKLQYRFIKVDSVKSAGIQDVYDLSIGLGKEPAYNVNGIVGHNTADAALSVFLEQLRAYRDMVTRKVFYDMLFPMVAVLNDLRDEDSKVDRKSRYEATSASRSMKDTGGGGIYRSQPGIMERQRNKENLLIPEVHWHKQLRPQADREYLDVLNTLSDKGVPVTLRAWAAAGGLSMERLMSELEDDVNLRQDIARTVHAAQPEDEGEYQEAARVLSGLLGRKKKTGRGRSLLSRDFGAQGEIKSTTKTGRPKLVHNQARANQKINQVIAGSLKRLSDANYYSQAVKQAKQKKDK